jgi:hypothetical protein
MTFRALRLSFDAYVLYVHRFGHEWVARIEREPTGLVMVLKEPTKEAAQFRAITVALTDVGFDEDAIASKVREAHLWKRTKLVLTPERLAD